MNSINRIPFFRERTRNTGIISCSVCLEEFQTPITCILFTKQKDMSVLLLTTLGGCVWVKRIRANTYNQSINMHLKSNDKTVTKNCGIISVGKIFSMILLLWYNFLYLSMSVVHSFILYSINPKQKIMHYFSLTFLFNFFLAHIFPPFSR